MNRQELFDNVTPVVANYVRSHYPGEDVGDRIQVALIAVWESLVRFDTSNPKANLKAWACYYARNAVRCQYRDQQFVGPKHQRLLREMRKEKEKLELVGEYSEEKLREVMNLSQKEYVAVVRAEELLTFKDIDGKSINHNDDSVYRPSLGDTIQAPPDKDELREALLECVMSLPEDDRNIVLLHDFEGYTMQEIRDMRVDSKHRKLSGLFAARQKALDRLGNMLRQKAGLSANADGNEVVARLR